EHARCSSRSARRGGSASEDQGDHRLSRRLSRREHSHLWAGLAPAFLFPEGGGGGKGKPCQNDTVSRGGRGKKSGGDEKPSADRREVSVSADLREVSWLQSPSGGTAGALSVHGGQMGRT